MTNEIYKMPATLTQVGTIVKRVDNVYFQGYLIVVGQCDREFDAEEAYEFATSILQLVKDFSPTRFEELVSEDKRWRGMLNSYSGTEKESDNSSQDQTE